MSNTRTNYNYTVKDEFGHQIAFGSSVHCAKTISVNRSTLIKWCREQQINKNCNNIKSVFVTREHKPNIKNAKKTNDNYGHTSKHCEDCDFLKPLTDGQIRGEKFCAYILIKQKSRGCKVNGCTKKETTGKNYSMSHYSMFER